VSDNDQPSPGQAALALQDVRRRRNEALGARREPLRMRIVFSVLCVGFAASYDVFKDPGVIPPLVAAAVVWAYFFASRTRRGAEVLGHRSTGLKDLPPAYTAIALSIVVAVLAAAAYVEPQVIRHVHHVPYWHTLGGLVLVAVTFPLSRVDQRWRTRLLERTRRGV
jgi:peptidoglycan biosynthesis protein MviN/MurJ (putative lipid II flippase)